MAGDAEPVKPLRVDRVESLDQQGRGIVRVDGKAVFVEGALPGERVGWEVVRSGQKFDLGRLVRIERASSQRVAPRCPHFGLWRGACGGCSMQHLDARAQVAVKQRVLEDALWHLGRLKPEQIMRPIAGVEWDYRHRARLSVRYVARKAEALVGFHERASSFVADIRECHVPAGPVGSLLVPLRSLVSAMEWRSFRPARACTPCSCSGCSIRCRHPIGRHWSDSVRLTGCQSGSSQEDPAPRRRWMRPSP